MSNKRQESLTSPTSGMAENCVNYATTNPDIAGIGVRVSFYLQTFLLVILVDRSWQEAPTALWTFIATSFGLTIATIVQHQSGGQLTLYQALQVSNLVWLANFGTFVALASYSRQKAASHKKPDARTDADYNVKFGAMIQTLFSMALTIYMWCDRNYNLACLHHTEIVITQGECRHFRKFATLLTSRKLYGFRNQSTRARRRACVYAPQPVV
ncbi:hypothetical protein K438DRAFT_624365 [Mycena galopus ATCC 62051]|nr:hypothetical protein K438DRAFT_624365 [Mycena galopus ATCC 62051]